MGRASRKRLEIKDRVQWTTNRYGIWRIEWSHDLRRLVNLKGQRQDPNMFGSTDEKDKTYNAPASGGFKAPSLLAFGLCEAICLRHMGGYSFKSLTLAFFLHENRQKAFSFRGLYQGICPGPCLGPPLPDPYYRLAIRALPTAPSLWQILDPPLLPATLMMGIKRRKGFIISKTARQCNLFSIKATNNGPQYPCEDPE